MERWREVDGEMEREREEMCSITISKLKHQKPKLRRDQASRCRGGEGSTPPKTPLPQILIFVHRSEHMKHD